MAKKESPLVSVVISTYNRKALLKRAIKSVLAQTMQDFELIVVDDCSTEDTEMLVKSFGDPRIRFYTTAKNSGHDAHPKNIGIKQARGEYICLLDDDDTYRPDALMILTRYIKEADCEVVYGDYVIDDGKGKMKPGWSIDFSARTLTQMNFISMPVVIMKREALVAIGGFDEEVPKFKDWNTWLRLHKNGARFMHVPIIIAEVYPQKDAVSDKFKNETDEAGHYLPTYFNPADCHIYPAKTALGKRKPLKVAIFTLTWNRLEYTKQMYKSIHERSGYAFDWFVIDQGSTDGTQEWIKSLTRDQKADTKWREKLRYKLYENNVGIAKGWNNAIEFIKSEGEYDIVVKVDNDAELMTQDWLKDMVEIFERNTTLILSPYVEGLEGAPGGVLRQRQSGDSPYVTINDRVLGVVPYLGGIVYAAPMKLYDDWKFNEKYEGNKDYLLSMYAAQNGYSLFYMEEYRVWHIDGTKGQKEKYPDYFKDPENKSAHLDNEKVELKKVA